MTQHHNFLRNILYLDAITCLAAGLLMSIGADALSPLLGLSVTLLRAAGLFLLPFAVLLWWLALRGAPAAGVRAVVAVNAAWVLGSAFVAAGGMTSPTMLGIVFVAVQAAGVAGLTVLEVAGLRRGARTA